MTDKTVSISMSNTSWPVKLNNSMINPSHKSKNIPFDNRCHYCCHHYCNFCCKRQKFAAQAGFKPIEHSTVGCCTLKIGLVQECKCEDCQLHFCKCRIVKASCPLKQVIKKLTYKRRLHCTWQKCKRLQCFDLIDLTIPNFEWSNRLHNCLEDLCQSLECCTDIICFCCVGDDDNPDVETQVVIGSSSNSARASQRFAKIGSKAAFENVQASSPVVGGVKVSFDYDPDMDAIDLNVNVNDEGNEGAKGKRGKKKGKLRNSLSIAQAQNNDNNNNNNNQKKKKNTDSIGAFRKNFVGDGPPTEDEEREELVKKALLEQREYKAAIRKDRLKETILMTETKKGRNRNVLALCETNELDIVSQKSDTNRTALEYAVYFGETTCFQIILKKLLDRNKIETWDLWMEGISKYQILPGMSFFCCPLFF